MEGIPENTNAKKMNMEYFDEYIALGDISQKAWLAAEEARVQATKVADAVVISWGKMWPISAKIEELIEAGTIEGEEVNNLKKEYEMAQKDYMEKKMIADDVIGDYNKKREIQKKAHEDFMEIAEKLMPSRV